MRISHFTKISTVLSLLVLLLCILSLRPAASDAAEKGFQCLPDRRGGFYLTSQETGKQKVIRISESGVSKNINLNSVNYTFASVGKNMIYFVSNFPECAYVSNERNQFTPYKYVLLDRVCVAGDNLVFDSDDNIFLIDINKPSSIQKFNKYGKFLQEINCPSVPDRLFFNDTDGSVYAFCSGKAFSTLTEKFLPGNADTTVSEPTYGKCSDKNGTVYSFSPVEGYKKLYTSVYGNACVSKSSVYSFSGKTVYIIGDDGKAISYFDTDTRIDSLISSKDTIAILSGQELTILDKNKFVPVKNIEDEESSHASQSVSSYASALYESSSYIPDKKESISSTVQTSEQSNINRTETLTISGGYLFIDHPMTLAVLKKELVYGDEICSVRNHNSMNVKNGNVGTGWTFAYPGNGTLTVILYGDMTGEGNINSYDIKALSSYLIKKKELSDTAKLAADLDKNKIIDLNDLFLLYNS